MTVTFHAVFFPLILAGEKDMRSKIELDSWKEWVRNFGSSDNDFLSKLGAWCNTYRIKVYPDTTTAEFCEELMCA